MPKQVYVASHDFIFDVWGTSQCDCGETKFVVWRADIGQFDEFHLSECVPYNGEIIPEKSGEGGVPDECQGCSEIEQCFPKKDTEIPMPWKTREAKEAERESIKSEEAFRRKMNEVAKSREKIIALKTQLEGAVPGTEVKSIGTVLGEMEPGSTIEVALRITDPDKFYGPPSTLGAKLANKIKEDAERRSKEGTRVGMTDPRGSGEMDINMGTERK